MSQLAEDVKSLAHRYIETTKQNESWVPLLPDLLALRQEAKQFLNIPRCAERLRHALSDYTDIDPLELQRLIDGMTGGSLEDAMQAARSWFEENLDPPSQ